MIFRYIELIFQEYPLEFIADNIRTSILTDIAKIISVLGTEEFLLPVVCIMFWVSSLRFSSRFCFVVLVAVISNFYLKGIFVIDRPPSYLWLENASGYSFPSGHAQIAIMSYGWLALNINIKKFKYFLWMIACLVGLTRPYLGVHYFSDVLFGYIIGLAFLVVISLSIERVALFIKYIKIYAWSALVLILVYSLGISINNPSLDDHWAFLGSLSVICIKWQKYQKVKKSYFNLLSPISYVFILLGLIGVVLIRVLVKDLLYGNIDDHISSFVRYGLITYWASCIVPSLQKRYLIKTST
jgi:membrane-associated phospholipid phosphatase